VERHVALADGPVLSIAPEELRGGGGPRAALDADAPDLATLERRYILATLDRHGGNRERTAEALGINKSTLWRRLRQYAADGEG
jgi:DNA-binding NtrC family response regulator